MLGETADLNEFLFGSERAALAVVRPVLLDIQQGRCFYCRSPFRPQITHVDHFIAWARYPVDLGRIALPGPCRGQLALLGVVHRLLRAQTRGRPLLVPSIAILGSRGKS